MATVPVPGTTGNDLLLIGDSNKNVLTGNAGNDYLDGKGGSDALSGGAGNDTLVYDPLDSKIDGGSGFDTLLFLGTNQKLNLTGNKVVIQMEEFKLSNGGFNSLAFTAADVIRVSDTDKFRLWGDKYDEITFNDSGWSFNGFTSTGFVQFKNGGASVEAQIGLWIKGFSGNASINFGAGADNGVTEDESTTTLTASGSIVVNDPNGQNFLTTQITPAVGNLGTLALGGSAIPGVSNGNYAYSVANALTQYLAEGQQRIDSFTVTSIDGSTAPLAFTIVGRNDAPVRFDSTSQSASVTEIADNAENENNYTHTRTGSFVITDVDLKDSLYCWVEAPTGQPGTLSVDPVLSPTTTSQRTVNWQYDVADASLDKLSDALLTQNYILHVSDRPQGTLDATVVDVTVQVNLQGTNDAPVRTDSVTQSVDVAEIADNAVDENDFTHTRTGSFVITDVDLADSLYCWVEAPTGQPGTLTVDPVLSPTNSSQRTVSWQYAVTDKSLDTLRDAVFTQNYVIHVSDRPQDTPGATVLNVTVQVNLDGANDGVELMPLRSGDVVERTISEASNAIGNTTIQSLGFKFQVRDVDLDDTFTVAASGTTSSASPIGILVDGSSNYDPTTGTRDVQYTFKWKDSQLDSLAQDQTLDQTFQVSVSDAQTTEYQTITLHFVGANDAPVRQSTGAISSSVSEFADGATGENTSSHTVTGSFVIRDVDQTDTLSRWIVNPASPKGTLSVTSITSPDTNGDRTVNWQYVVADSKLDSLRAAQSIVENFSIKVSDREKDTSGATVLDIPVAITLNGANDAPFRNVVNTDVITGSVTELASNDANANSGTFIHHATGSFQVKDVDIGDTLTQQSIVQSAPNNATYGALTITNISSADASGIRTVSWSYAASDLALNPLPAGSGPTQTFAITLKDGSNATVTQNVNISLTGAADGPSFGGDKFKIVSEFNDGDYQENFGVHTVSGTVTATNMPAGSLLVEQVGFPGDAALGSFTAKASAIDANGNATISWTYVVADCLLDVLNGGGQSDQVQLLITHSANSQTTQITQTVSIALAGNVDFSNSSEVTYFDGPGNAADYSTSGFPSPIYAALQVYGNDNNDTLRTGSDVPQTLFGGDGDDTFKLSSGMVFAVGGTGNDRFDFNAGSSTVWAWGQQGNDIFDISDADPNATLWAMDFTLGVDHIVAAAGAAQFTLTQGTTSRTDTSSEGFNPNVADGTPYYLLVGPNTLHQTIQLHIIGTELASLDAALLFN